MTLSVKITDAKEHARCLSRDASDRSFPGFGFGVFGSVHCAPYSLGCWPACCGEEKGSGRRLYSCAPAVLRPWETQSSHSSPVIKQLDLGSRTLRSAIYLGHPSGLSASALHDGLVSGQLASPKRQMGEGYSMGDGRAVEGGLPQL